MSTFTSTDIIHALTVLQTTCREYYCTECPLGDDNGNCRLSEQTPATYSINTVNVAWRALKSTSDNT